MIYNWGDWYWLADDKRVFSSLRQLIVNDQDADYLKFAEHTTPTGWPRDNQGNQTNAALQDVLTPYNIYVDLYAYSASERWKKNQAGILVGGRPFPTDPVAQADLNAAYIYTNEAGNAGQVYQWKLIDGTWMTLNKAGVEKMQSNVHNFKENCFTAEQEVAVGISNGTIKTRANVDAAYTAVSNVYPPIT